MGGAGVLVGVRRFMYESGGGGGVDVLLAFIENCATVN